MRTWLLMISAAALAAAGCGAQGTAAATLDDVGGNVTGLEAYQIVAGQIASIDEAGVRLAPIMAGAQPPAPLMGPITGPRIAVGANATDALFGCPAAAGTTCAPLVVDASAHAVRMLAALPADVPWAISATSVVAPGGTAATGGSLLVEPLDGSGGATSIALRGTGTVVLAIVASVDGKTLAALVRDGGADHVFTVGADGSGTQDLGTTNHSATATAAPLLAAANLGGSSQRIVVVDDGHDLYDIVAPSPKLLYQAPGAVTSVAITTDRMIAWGETSSGGGQPVLREWVETASPPVASILAEPPQPIAELTVSRSYLFWSETLAGQGQIWIGTPSTATARALGAAGASISSVETDMTYAYGLVAPSAGSESWIGRVWYGSL